VLKVELRELIIEEEMKKHYKKISTFFSQESIQSGYSLLEMLVVITVIITLLSLVTTNLFRYQHTSQLSSTVNSFLADYKEQQIKAMEGDTQASGSISDYGIHFETASYTLFRNAYGTANFSVSLPAGTQFSTTLPNAEIIFSKGSGEVSGFVDGQNTITLKDTGNNSQMTITFNKYGVITSVN
jgi:prepilin-type N-terminal cleavage/methylation domain-containing protein